VKYLGWDPGMRYLGWGVLELGPTSSRALAWGTLGEANDRPWHERLDELAHGIDVVMNTHLPDVVAYEDQAGIEVAMQRDGADSGMGGSPASRRLHEVCGMIRYAARCALDAPLPCYCIQPRTIKVSVLGKGRGSGDKSQIQSAIRALFGVKDNQHASDALATAVAGSRKHRQAMMLLRRSASVIR
jgi:crossover junction endodeoxyribonuclease RuvC